MIEYDHDRGALRLNENSLLGLISHVNADADAPDEMHRHRQHFTLSLATSAGVASHDGLLIDPLQIAATALARPWAHLRIDALASNTIQTHRAWLAPTGAALVTQLPDDTLELFAVSVDELPLFLGRLIALGPRKRQLNPPTQLVTTESMARLMATQDPTQAASQLPDSNLKDELSAGRWRTAGVSVSWEPRLFASDQAPANTEFQWLDTPSGFYAIVAEAPDMALVPIASMDLWTRMVTATQPPTSVDATSELAPEAPGPIRLSS